MTANLPDNVQAATAYTVRCTNDAQGFSNITVATSDDYTGCLKLRQDGDTILIDPADVPGLIAALQAAAGVTAPQDPAFVVDDDGDRWNRNADGTYSCERVLAHCQNKPLGYIAREYGIQGTA